MAMRLVDIAKNNGIAVKYDEKTNTVNMKKGNTSITFENGQGQEYGLNGLENGYNMVKDQNQLLNNFSSNRYDISYTPKDNSDYISSSLKKQSEAAKNNIDLAVSKKIGNLKNQVQETRRAYYNQKKELASANEAGKRQLSETIANMGNSQAGGYAMSKRLSNQNAYNKEFNNINTSENQAIGELYKEMEDTKFQGEMSKFEIDREYADKLLNLSLSEDARRDSMNFEIEKANNQNRFSADSLDEQKRMNSFDIYTGTENLKINQERNQREDEEHRLNMQYLPQRQQLELEQLTQSILNSIASRSKTYTEIEKAKADTEKIKADTEKAKADTEKTRTDTEKSKAEIDRIYADTSRIQSEKKRIDAAARSILAKLGL